MRDDKEPDAADRGDGTRAEGHGEAATAGGPALPADGTGAVGADPDGTGTARTDAGADPPPRAANGNAPAPPAGPAGDVVAPGPGGGGNLPPWTPPQAQVHRQDVWVLLGVSVAALAAVSGFVAWLVSSGLIAFPDMSATDAGRGFFEDGLIYRERRVASALLLRTFVTSFAFVIGLALCTMGGLFILRQVTSLTAITGQLGASPLAAPEGENGGTVTRRLRETQFSFVAYSPGVVFMVGGVFVMSVTQYLAIEVTTIETIPRTVVSSFCIDERTRRWNECTPEQLGEAARAASAAGSQETVTAFPPAPTE